jgi:DNA polymerase-3 subunit epsilon
MLSDTSLSEGTFVAVDIETTGCLPGQNGIIELGAARIEAGRIVATFSELVRPGEPIPYSIQALTGISDGMVENAPSIEDVFQRFRDFSSDAVLVAHNYRFDLGFLDHYAELTTGESFPRPVLDTLALAKRLRPELGKYNLGVLAAEFGASTPPTHRADADAYATAEVFLAMVPELAVEGVTNTGEAARFCRMGGQQSLARKLVLTTGLPDVPGVYLLRDDDGRVVYTGRAKNLRARLRSYFYVNSDANGPRLGEETVSIQYIPCHSPLDAVLLQSRLINRYHPKYNVPAQRGDFASLIHIDTAARFPALKVTDGVRATGRSLGPFVNRWAVEALVEQLREVYGLRRCAARITKRAGEVACDFRESGECPGPCVGRIDPDEYQARVAEALAVFDESAEGLRRELEQRHERALHDGDHEGAIRTRDALKALERSMSGLRLVREATSRPGLIILEPQDGTVALHLVRFGYLARTLRLKRSDWGTPRFEDAVRRGIHRAYYSGPYVDNPVEYTPQQLKDVFLIENYRSQSSPPEILVGEDEEATAAAVMTWLRRHLRITRRRHVLTSNV